MSINGIISQWMLSIEDRIRKLETRATPRPHDEVEAKRIDEALSDIFDLSQFETRVDAVRTLVFQYKKMKENQ